MIKISNKSEWIEKNKTENDKKNSNFIQIYRKKMPYLRSVLKKNDGAFSLFMFLIEHMDQKNSVICSMQVLCDFFEVSRQTISKRVKILIDSGLISVLKSGTTNIYIANPEIVWSSWKNTKKYCKFESNILLSLNEQEKHIYNLEMEKMKKISLK
jgi:hypothetical protein